MESLEWDDEPAFYVSELSQNTVKHTAAIHGKMQFSKQKNDVCDVAVYWERIVAPRPLSWPTPRQMTRDEVTKFIISFDNARKHGLEYEFTEFFFNDFMKTGDVDSAIWYADCEWDL